MPNLPSQTLMRPSFAAAFRDEAFIRAMLRFETALALAEAREGVIPLTAAAAISTAAQHLTVNTQALLVEAKASASLAVPAVKALTAAVAQKDPRAAAFVHLGATSQDVLDCAMLLAAKPPLDELDAVVQKAIEHLVTKAHAHRNTLMLARTLMQPAVPISAGIKLARWALMLRRCLVRIRAARQAAQVVQLGGPAGTLDALGPKHNAVRARLAHSLGLQDGTCWHTDRGHWHALLSSLALLVIAISKIARDVSLLAQPEMGEMSEMPQTGRGASSAMPHKRNPIACVHALAAANIVPGLMSSIFSSGLHEHERALGGWQAELAVLPLLFDQVGSALDALDGIASTLVINEDAMRANLNAQNGLVYSDRLARALAPHMGRGEAMALVEVLCAQASETGRHLRDVATAELATRTMVAHAAVVPVLDAVFSEQAVASVQSQTLDELFAMIDGGA